MAKKQQKLSKVGPRATTQVVESSLLDRASRIAQRVDIYEIRLVASMVQSKWRGEKPPPLRMDGRSFRAERDDAKDLLRIDTSFIFVMAEDTEESKVDPPVMIQATFQLVYQVPELASFDKGDIDAFANANAFHNAWPFWREFVYTTMSRMGLPPISLPVFRIAESKEKKEELAGGAK